MHHRRRRPERFDRDQAIVRHFRHEPRAGDAGKHLRHQMRRHRQHVGLRRLSGREPRQADEREEPVGRVVVRRHRGKRRRRLASARDALHHLLLLGVTGRFEEDVFADANERLDHRRIVHTPAALPKNLDGRFVGKPLAVRAIRSQRVETVDDRQNACADRNRLAGDAVRIAAAVPILVMAAHDRHDGEGESHQREDVRADVDVELHLLELGLR